MRNGIFSRDIYSSDEAITLMRRDILTSPALWIRITVSMRRLSKSLRDALTATEEDILRRAQTAARAVTYVRDFCAPTVVASAVAET